MDNLVANKIATNSNEIPKVDLVPQTSILPQVDLVLPTIGKTADKSVRFKNAAENKANRIMSEIEGMKKLSNRKYYEYSVEQVAELFGAIQSELDKVKEAFTTGTVDKKKFFTFSE
jgi:hypothetical protein